VKKPLYRRLYFQVLIGILLGVIVGHFYPDIAIQLKPLGTAFTNLIKMMAPPIIFCTIVVGIAKIGDMKEVGRVGLKALIYFEVVSTIALLLGLMSGNILAPGKGLNQNVSELDPSQIQRYVTRANEIKERSMLDRVIPKGSIVQSFAEGEMLQILLFAVLFGVSLSHFGTKGKFLIKILDQCSHTLFGVIGIIMKLAPLGAFGAMAGSVGELGVDLLKPLAKLLLVVYFTCGIFIFCLLGPVMRSLNLRLWKFLLYIKEEIFIVLGTSSSETVLPRLITKLENLGCSKSVVGLVVPTGYSFNLDGTSIYLTLAALFIAQATNTVLTWSDQCVLLGVFFLTSKGAAAIPGGGLVTLAMTLSTTGIVPFQGLALILGIDFFMSEVRSVTNLIGNGVAAIAVSKWEGALDIKRARRVLNCETVEEADQPEEVADAAMPEEV
jgi:aerobic C4-dicarboxylate transport protein